MKKLLVLFGMFLIGLGALASGTEDVKQFFTSCINAANSYKSDYFSCYTPNAVIKRVVIKKDGSTETVVIPFADYKKHSAMSARLGKLTHYKNTYTNIEINPEGSDFRVTAMRKPSTSSYSLPASFLIGKDSSGNLKIKEESMHTKVQTFLKKHRKSS